MEAWIVVSAAPAAHPAGPVEVTGDDLRAWVRRQVSAWPAPVPIGTDEPRLDAVAVTFAPAGSADRYRCTLGRDGSSVLALPAGAERESPGDGVPVCVIGEGAVAWITVAAARLAAAYAEHVGVHGDMSLEVAIAPRGDGPAGPYEVWNHGPHGFGPAGRRLAAVRPARASVAVAACLAAGLARTVRPLVLGVLGQFGLVESRHIDVDGVIQRRNFTGYDDRILAWTSAIGVPSER